LITELGRAHWFSIVARNTSFNYKGNAADSKQIAWNSACRVWSRASCARRAAGPDQLPARLKRRAASIFGSTVSTVLSTILSICRTGSPKASSARSAVLHEAEIEPARRKPETEQDAYNLTLRAFNFRRDPRTQRGGAGLLREALGIDPARAMANALEAWCLQQRHLMDWPAAQPDDREKARRLARVAIAGRSDVSLPLAP